MEYFIEEKTPTGTLFHGSVFSRKEALEKIDRIKANSKTQNPISFRAEFVPINQIEDLGVQSIEITTEDLYKEVYGADADLGLADEAARQIYELCAKTANTIVAEKCLLNFERARSPEETIL